MKTDPPSKSNDKTADRTQIENDEKEATAILARRIERAAGRASGTDYIPNAANPVAVN